MRAGGGYFPRSAAFACLFSAVAVQLGDFRLSNADYCNPSQTIVTENRESPNR